MWTCSSFYRLYSFTADVDDEQKHYVRKLSAKLKMEVVSFYHSCGVSVQLPDRRYVGKRFLIETLHIAHNMYQTVTGSKIGFSTFAKLRPKDVKLSKSTPHRQCLCDKCENMEQLCRKVTSLGIKGINKSVKVCLGKMMCPPKTISYGSLTVNDIQCVLRVCTSCGLQHLKDDIVQNNTRDVMLQKCTWNMWTQEKIKNTTKLVNKEYTGTYLEVVNAFLQQLHSFALHMFNAKWQVNDFKMLKSNLRPGELLMVHDFAQNYLCISQDEAQGGHFLHEQVTIHPSICFRACSTPKCNKIVCEEIIHISSDGLHDNFAVTHFRNSCVQDFERRGISVDRVYEFSDQAPQQYKSCNAFYHLSKAQKPSISNFFGVQHGKSVADGAAGRVKCTAWVGVLTKQANIQNSKHFYDYCKKKMETKNDDSVLCTHYRVAFKNTRKIK